VGRLEEEFGANIPIGNRISELADEYRERLFREIEGRNKQVDS
jgi:hypothetical protein